VLVALAGAYGVLLRIWLLAHLPLFGDEATVGLMARGILAGHFDAFYWGSTYSGGEPYVVAAVLGVANGGPMALNATPAILAAGAAILAYAVLVGSGVTRRVAALGAAMVWVWPYAAVWNSVREIGMRGFTLCCGLALLLCAVRIHHRVAGNGTYLLMGLAAGAGWWASPEIVYFVVPAAILLLASWARLTRSGRSAPWRVVPPLLAVAGAVVGALPWIHANIRSGFASLHTVTPPPAGFDHSGRLSVFFQKALPMQLGLRSVPGGAWVGGPTVGVTLYVVVLVLLGLLTVRAAWSTRLGRRSAPVLAAGVAVVAFPFLYSFFPTSWYWADGRYGVYLPPLIVLLAIWSFPSAMVPLSPGDTSRRPAHARRRQTRGRAVITLAGIALLSGAFSTVVLARESAGVPTQPKALLSGWSDPNEAARQVVRSMAAHHIRTAYGDYWTAYTLDFLAPNTVVVSPSPLDLQRSATLARTVARATPQAWLFFAPGHRAAANAAFTNPEPGPGYYTLRLFTSYLFGRHIGYRVVKLGILDAVVPDRPVRHLPPSS
jgi:hypothetical protein